MITFAHPDKLVMLLMVALTAATMGVLAIQDMGTFTISTPNLSRLDSASASEPTYDKAKPFVADTSQNFEGLFGTPLPSNSTASQQALPRTRLELVLKGTFTHTNELKASALIALPNKSAKSYLIGDTLPGDAELVSINKGEVVLRRNGRDERLTLPILQAKDTSSHHLGIGNRITSTTTEFREDKKRQRQPISNDSKGYLKERLSALRESANNK